MAQESNDFFTDKMKAWGVPVMCAIISVFGSFILKSITEVKDELRLNRDNQIRWQEQMGAINQRLESYQKQQEHITTELDAIKTHVYRWE